MDLVKIPLKILTWRVNQRLQMNYDEPYISRVRCGKAGSSSLKDIVRQVEQKIIREAFESQSHNP